MPKGPQGQVRPHGIAACALHVVKIATGEIAKDGVELPPRPPDRPDDAPPHPDPEMAEIDVPIFGTGLPMRGRRAKLIRAAVYDEEE